MVYSFKPLITIVSPMLIMPLMILSESLYGAHSFCLIYFLFCSRRLTMITYLICSPHHKTSYQCTAASHCTTKVDDWCVCFSISCLSFFCSNCPKNLKIGLCRLLNKCIFSCLKAWPSLIFTLPFDIQKSSIIFL